MRVTQERIHFFTAEMVESTNHSIKQKTVAEKGINRRREEEPLRLDADTEELVDEGPFVRRQKR